MAQPINRIVINENDLTTSGRQINEDNTVFIIGASINATKVTSSYNELMLPVNYIGELTEGAIEDITDDTKDTTITTPDGDELKNIAATEQTPAKKVYKPQLNDVVLYSDTYYIYSKDDNKQSTEETYSFKEVTEKDFKYEYRWLKSFLASCHKNHLFSNNTLSKTWKYEINDKKIGRWANTTYNPFVLDEPMYITSLSEFDNIIGETPYIYDEEIEYPERFFNSKANPNKKSLFSPMFKAGDIDPSYVMAKQLLGLGLPILYLVPNPMVEVEGSEDKVENPVAGIYKAYDDQLKADYIDEDDQEVHFLHIFDYLNDKNMYNVKYVCTGGYPIFEYRAGAAQLSSKEDPNGFQLTQNILDIIVKRGDCYLLLDEIKCPERPLNVNGLNDELPAPFNKSMFSHVSNANFEGATYAATITCWGVYKNLPYTINYVKNNVNTRLKEIALPNSFGYLSELAISLKNNPSWLSIAGVTRGRVRYLDHLNTIERLTNTIADSYQSKDDLTSLNAITDIKPYGLTIWGNRTLLNNAAKEGLTASSFLNIRNMVCDVKKEVYRACKRLLFEQNNDILWVNFKSQITPLLNRMLTGYGIKDYKIIQGQTTEKYKLVAVIKLFPVYALEEVEVTIELADEEISVSE